MPAGFQDHVDPIVVQELANAMSDRDSDYVTDTPVGESVFPRSTGGAGSTAPSSQSLILVGFTAKATQNISQIRTWSSGTAAGATPTLVRLGVWLRDSTNTYNLVASTPNDITLYAATNTTYTKGLSAAFGKTAGNDYLVGILIVSAAALPTFAAPATGATAYYTDSLALFPQVAGLRLAAQADLPNSFTAASLSISTTANFHALLLQ